MDQDLLQRLDPTAREGARSLRLTSRVQQMVLLEGRLVTCNNDTETFLYSPIVIEDGALIEDIQGGVSVMEDSGSTYFRAGLFLQTSWDGLLWTPTTPSATAIVGYPASQTAYRLGVLSDRAAFGRYVRFAVGCKLATGQTTVTSARVSAHVAVKTWSR